MNSGINKDQVNVKLVFGIPENSIQANAILELANTSSVTELDKEIGLDKRAAKNIVEHRNGLDGKPGTTDDNPISTLKELDKISWIGKRAFQRLQEFSAQ